MKDVLKKQQQYAHPISKVWAAITEQEQISAWFIKCNFKAEQGYRYSLISENDNCEQVSGIIQKVSPVNELVYSWIVAGSNVETIVSWTLQENNDGTLLTLEHSGISKYPTEETAIKYFESFDGGWDKCIDSLNSYLAGEQVEAAHGK